MRKGFFFSLDAFFAIMIFTLVLVSVYSYFVSVEELRQQYFYSEDLIDIFTNIKMGEVELVIPNPDLLELRAQGLIDDDLTIMEQLIELDKDNPENAELLFSVLVYNLMERYGVSLDVGRRIIYQSGEEGRAIVSRQRYTPTG